MKQQSVFKYYAFGYNYNLLKNDNSGLTTKELVERIEEHLEYYDELDLQVTQAASKDLKDIFKMLKKSGKMEEVITEDLNKSVCESVEQIDRTLDAELGLVKAFVLSSKKFDLRNLLENPKRLFLSGTFEVLTQEVIDDIGLGFRCIAFECATASAFHLLRATEGALKMMYFSFVKKNRIPKPMWFGMVNALRKKRNPRPPQELLDHLDVIRKNYRNPTQHPEKFYTIDEAQDLASNCISAINMMAAAIRDHESF